MPLAEGAGPRPIDTDSPWMAMVPDVGRSRKFRQRRKVLLPEPLAPITLTTDPGATVSEMPRNTSVSAYDL
jgi:hypothetical protein